MINDLKAQLARCESWLLEEPDDQEVIEKANELRIRIESLENAPEENKSKKKEGVNNEIKRLKRKIRNLKKKLINQPESPVILEEISTLESQVEKMKLEREVK